VNSVKIDLESLNVAVLVDARKYPKTFENSKQNEEKMD
jgi:hypothetical protein